MKNLSLEQFNPKKSEISKLVEGVEKLEIKDINDKVGYLAVHEKRMSLKKARVDITKQGKELRATALKFQKDVIVLENELVGMIEPAEKALKEKQDKIDEEKAIIKRREDLPERQEKLKKIELVFEDDFILLMDDKAFNEFYNDKKEEYLEEKERKLQEEKDRIEQEKRDEQIRKEAEEKAREDEKRKAKEEKERLEREKKEALEKAEAEKQALIDEQKAKEKARIEKEKENKRLAEEKIANEKAEKEKNEKKKEYTDWLKKNNYNDKDFIVNKDGNKFTMYKKVSEIVIK